MASPSKARAGYSLLETMFALAIMALGAAFILPRAANTMDQVVAHAVFFDFQRQVSDLRRRAFRSQTPLVLISPAAASDGTSNGPTRVVLSLNSGWSYTLSRPLGVSAGGECDSAVADLVSHGKVRVHLVSKDGACHFTRLW